MINSDLLKVKLIERLSINQPAPMQDKILTNICHQISIDEEMHQTLIDKALHYYLELVHDLKTSIANGSTKKQDMVEFKYLNQTYLIDTKDIDFINK